MSMSASPVSATFVERRKTGKTCVHDIPIYPCFEKILPQKLANYNHLK